MSHAGADGSVKSIDYDISRFGANDNNTLGPILESGDVVIVPRGETFILADEVNHPGPATRRELSVSPNKPMRLSTLIYATGGLKTGANRKLVKILRLAKDGTRIALAADLDAQEKHESKSAPVATAPAPANAAAADSDPVLADGDIVVVAPTGGIAVIGKVRQPNVYPVNGQSIKLTRIIALAGGFAEFAKPSAVLIIKAGNPGNVIHVDTTLIQKGGFQDPDLEEGDLVFVPERLL